MSFVGNQTWFVVLLVIHVIGAIVGIGPAFAFGILGAQASKAGPEGSVALINALRTIERAMLRPVTLSIQWITGTLLIFNRGLNHGFFTGRNRWLVVSIGVYAVLLLLGEFVYAPNTTKLLAAAKSGNVDEIQRQSKRAKAIGPVAPLLTIVIIVLMVWKPGSGCVTLSC